MKKLLLCAMVVAEKVYRDSDTGKFLIIGTFRKVTVHKRRAVSVSEEAIAHDSEISGPAVVLSEKDVGDAGTPSLYLAMAGIREELKLRLRYVKLDTEEVFFEGRFEVHCTDPLVLVEKACRLPSLVGPAGAYSLDLLCDGELLGQWRITVETIEEKES